MRSEKIKPRETPQNKSPNYLINKLLGKKRKTNGEGSFLKVSKVYQPIIRYRSYLVNL